MNTRVLWGAATLGAGGVTAAVFLTRRLAQRSGATNSEADSSLPGDELIPDPQIQTTRAITIHAPVAAVWPWVAQLGYHRGGWYTNARLDKLLWRIDNPSADRILPEFQHVEVGDTVPDGPEGTARGAAGLAVPGCVLTTIGLIFAWRFPRPGAAIEVAKPPRTLSSNARSTRRSAR
jgi:hypothetical protein